MPHAASEVRWDRETGGWPRGLFQEVGFNGEMSRSQIAKIKN